MKKKMKFTWCGVNFELPTECLRTTDYWNKPLENPYIYIGRKECPAIAKQFVKKKYPQLLVWGSSDTFANGNSASVYVCNADGTPLDRASKEWKDIYGFVDQMSGGRYNGMEDIYEYGDSGATDNGTKLDFGTKHLHINNEAPFGSWPSVLSHIKGLMNGEYVFGVQTKEQSIERVKKYATASNIDKALRYI